uniref:Uncharacterized protein n=1 Tax=Arundo donax TaxID=35708 RepID=A0A0A8ZY55_ARUDO
MKPAPSTSRRPVQGFGEGSS